MRASLPRLALTALLLAPLVAISAQQPVAAPRAPAPPGGRQFTVADLEGWKTIRSATLSDDGRWFAYVLAPNEGDGEVVIRGTAEGARELRFPIGAPTTSQFNPFAGPVSANAPLAISGDGRYAAFTMYATQRETKRLEREHRPARNDVAVVNLATGEEKRFEHVRRFAFAGDKPEWIALYTYAPEAAPTSGGGAQEQGGAAPAAGRRAEARRDAADLVLYDMSTGETVNIGNVGDFAFDHSGAYLAWTVDASDAIGDGVQLRDMRSGVVRSLDSDRAVYRQLAWADSALGLAVVRGTPDSVSHDTAYIVLAWTGFGAAAPRELAFDPRKHPEFPAATQVSADRAPKFAADLSTVFFGIRAVDRQPPRAGVLAASDGRGVVQAGAPGAGGAINQPKVDESGDELPTLVLWHWKDPRLQSQQMVQLPQDRSYSYLAEYRFADRRFVRLADDSLRTVNVLPLERHAFGTDTRAYDQPASYSGRQYADVYRVDLASGARTLVMRKHPVGPELPSPDGRRVLYWGEDGNWWILDAATGDTRNITKDVPTTFANTEDDHNNLYPPARPAFGWAKDGSAVLLFDGWDAWKVPVAGGAAVNLTVDGRRRRVRYQTLYATEEGASAGTGRARGGENALVDLTRPLYFGAYGEWTKQEGLARVEPGRAGTTMLVWDDAKYAYTKAKKAPVFVYSRQTFSAFPDYYVASADLRGGRRITDANPQQKELAWSSGTRLVTYVSDKGDTLQGALYLPANYEPGKKYPLLVTIYEKRSQGLHQYAVPSDTRTPDPSVYTSRGYAVLDPDIVYRVNDPGMSAVWCVVPAVKAAIATGIVDSARVRLWGHSWGGYQTAFLVTQTNIFKAAIAGAPLTDMVSMYSSVYWNSGGTNQAIFESSQGRFKGNFTDNYDAYIRNSPVFHAKDVHTPLVILHDDKDGAVDFNQGITYFNTLRQLGKEVILLEYVGENHGLARPVNQKDYAVRMREWFDHYLLGTPAPAWMTDGIPRLKMEEDLRERVALVKPAPERP